MISLFGEVELDGQLESGSEVSAVLCSATQIESSMSDQEIRVMQFEDAGLRWVMSWFKRDVSHNVSTSDPLFLYHKAKLQGKLRLEDGILFYEDRLCLSKRMIPIVIHEVHSTPTGGHWGVEKIVERLRSRFFFPNMRKLVLNWIQSCPLCVCRKFSKSVRVPMKSLPADVLPWEFVQLDHVGKISGDEEFPYLLVIVDRATKWIEAFPCKTTSAEETAKILYEQWISRFSVPKIIHSDKGASFQSAVFREMCRLLGIQKINTTPLAPWSNGLAENAGRIVIKVVTRFVQENPLKWRQYLTSALFSYRTSVNASIGMSP